METVALFGAAGSMGTLISERLRDHSDYELLPVETGEDPKQTLRDRGQQPIPEEEATRRADIVILAVPDTVIGTVARQVVSQLEDGALVVTLDPAAAHAGELPEQQGVSYFITHPAHLPLFNEETEPEARTDYFGMEHARQPIVCALQSGPDEDYERGETLARTIWGPVTRAHRVTVEQMAILEPVLGEQISINGVALLKEAMEEAVDQGVPRQAARDFLLGHLHIELAIFFDELDWELSEGAQKTYQSVKSQIIDTRWKELFTSERVKQSVRDIVGNRNDE